MRIARGIVAACLLLTVPACMSNNKGKIEGTKWTSLAATVKGQSCPPNAMQLEFGKDGSLVYRVGGVEIRGTYSLGMGNYVTFKFNQDVEGRKSHTEQIDIGNNVMTLSDSVGTVSFRPM